MALTQRHQAEVSARALRFAEAVPLTDIPELLAQIRARVKACEIEDSTNVRLHLAASIKAHILSGTGVLIEVENNDLKHHHHLAIDATTLVQINQGEHIVYVDVNGVYQTQKAANASISRKFTELYKPHITPNPRGKPFSVCWFHGTPWEVYLDENTFRQVEREPELIEDDVLNSCLTEEQVVSRIVASVAEAYKRRRERLHQLSDNHHGV
ncbi:hypothetical protein [Pseudomonas putida]|nr:hypothetical protein [Pseudomonas putida]QOD01648.1 hypothetical protein ID616_30985 [Pseudomonas putida]